MPCANRSVSVARLKNGILINTKQELFYDHTVHSLFLLFGGLYIEVWLVELLVVKSVPLSFGVGTFGKLIIEIAVTHSTLEISMGELGVSLDTHNKLLT